MSDARRAIAMGLVGLALVCCSPIPSASMGLVGATVGTGGAAKVGQKQDEFYPERISWTVKVSKVQAAQVLARFCPKSDGWWSHRTEKGDRVYLNRRPQFAGQVYFSPNRDPMVTVESHSTELNRRLAGLQHNLKAHSYQWKQTGQVGSSTGAASPIYDYGDEDEVVWHLSMSLEKAVSIIDSVIGKSRDWESAAMPGGGLMYQFRDVGQRSLDAVISVTRGPTKATCKLFAYPLYKPVREVLKRLHPLLKPREPIMFYF